MAEKLSTTQRSNLMSHVRGKNTAPELLVRSALHKLGYRFRLHRKDLPGTPDIVLPKFKLCIFVHGCFWHQHPKCKRASLPVKNREFWIEKFRQNKLRDNEVNKQLMGLGWRTVVIWECETKNIDQLNSLLKDRFAINIIK